MFSQERSDIRYSCIDVSLNFLFFNATYYALHVKEKKIQAW